MKIYKIKISKEENLLIEKKHYEYAGNKDMISFLMNQKDIAQKEILQEYIIHSQKNFMELEKEKEFLSQKYLPDELKNKNYNYTFNFIDESIIYEY